MNQMEDDADTPPELEIVVGSIFDSHAGRSALVVRLVCNKFVANYDPLVEDSYRKEVTVDGERIVLNIIDTAGGEEYSIGRDSYEKKCDRILLVYDVTNRTTFDGLEDQCDHYCRVRDVTKHELPIVLCGNKCDCSDSERQVLTSEGQSFADKYGYPFIETSAKDNINVEEAFFTVVRTYLNDNSSANDREKVKKHHRPTCIIY